MAPGWRADADLFTRERALRLEAERAMADLKLRGAGWEEAWKTHPVAIAYRALLKEAWTVNKRIPLLEVPIAGKEEG